MTTSTFRPVLAVLALAALLGATPLSAQLSEELLLAPAAVETPPAPPQVTIPSFAQRAVLASVGSAAGFVALGYTTFAMKGGPEGCDLCWEVTVAGFAGGIVGAAAATTLVGGNFRGGLKGALLGAAAGLAVVGIAEELADLDEDGITLAFAVPFSLITAHFSGR